MTAEAKRQKIRSEQNKAKSVKEKQKRFSVRTGETVKRLTNNKCEVLHLENEKRKIRAEEIHVNCDLAPRFHLDTLEFLVDNQFFEDDAMEIIDELLIKMKKTQKDVKEHNLIKIQEKKKKKGSQGTLLKFFSSTNQPSVAEECESCDE